MTLRIKIRRGERVIIEGVPLRFNTSAQIDFVRRTDFLPGRRTLSDRDVTTGSSRLYYAIQETYIQPRTERMAHLDQLLIFLDQMEGDIRESDISSINLEELAQIRRLVVAGEYFPALKLVSQMIEREDPEFWAVKRQRDQAEEQSEY